MIDSLKTIVYLVVFFMFVMPLCLLACILLIINADWLALKVCTLAMTAFKKVCVFIGTSDDILNAIDDSMTIFKDICS